MIWIPIPFSCLFTHIRQGCVTGTEMNDDCRDVCDVTLKDVDENNPHKKKQKKNQTN